GTMAALLAGCATTGQGEAGKFADVPPGFNAVTLTNQLDPTLLRPSQELFTLGPGDVVDIEVARTPGTRALTTVGPDGKMYFYLLPGLDVWGLTLVQARDLLQKELAKYITSPEVSISLRSVGSKHVWVLGRLNKPGIYPM